MYKIFHDICFSEYSTKSPSVAKAVDSKGGQCPF